MTNWYAKFRQNAGKSPAKESNTVKDGKVLPFPELTQDQRDKLDFMFSALIPLHGKNYSTLSLNEKRLVEMFCKRYTVSKEDDRTVLKINAYAHKFVVKALGTYFKQPSYSEFHIIEDEKLTLDELYGNPYDYSGSPFHDALNSFPDNYLPVRSSNGKYPLFAVYSGQRGTDLETYIYKERKSVVPEEPKYNPLGLAKAQEVPTQKEPDKYLNAIQRSIKFNMLSPVSAAFLSKYLESPESFPEYQSLITGELLALLEGFPKDTPAYQQALIEISASL